SPTGPAAESLLNAAVMAGDRDRAHGALREAEGVGWELRSCRFLLLPWQDSAAALSGGFATRGRNGGKSHFRGARRIPARIGVAEHAHCGAADCRILTAGVGVWWICRVWPASP